MLFVDDDDDTCKVQVKACFSPLHDQMAGLDKGEGGWTFYFCALLQPVTNTLTSTPFSRPLSLPSYQTLDYDDVLPIILLLH